MANGTSHNAEALLATATRRQFVLEKRRAGLTYREIAAAAKKAFGADRLPKHWDERYAHKDLTRELQRVRTELEETSAEMRVLELQRLDAMLSRVWRLTETGSPKAIETVLKIQKRRARLMGLDAPHKHDVISREMDIDWEELTDRQLERIIEGEDVRTVINDEEG